MIYIVTASHYSNPTVVITAHRTEDGARKRASQAVEMIMEDAFGSDSTRVVAPYDFESALEKMRERLMQGETGITFHELPDVSIQLVDLQE